MSSGIGGFERQYDNLGLRLSCNQNESQSYRTFKLVENDRICYNTVIQHESYPQVVAWPHCF